MNVHRTFRRRPGRLLNVLCTFNLHPVSTGMVHDFKIIRLGYPCNFFSTKTILTTSLATGCPTVSILSSIGCRPCLIARVSVNSGRAAVKRPNTILGTKRKFKVYKEVQRMSTKFSEHLMYIQFTSCVQGDDQLEFEY